jgi:hypothetical protein
MKENALWKNQVLTDTVRCKGRTILTKWFSISVIPTYFSLPHKLVVMTTAEPPALRCVLTPLHANGVSILFLSRTNQTSELTTCAHILNTSFCTFSRMGFAIYLLCILIVTGIGVFTTPSVLPESYRGFPQICQKISRYNLKLVHYC